MRLMRFLTPLVVLGLAGCGTLGTPEPLPTVVLQGGSQATPAPQAAGRGGVTASGGVVPAQEAGTAAEQALANAEDALKDAEYKRTVQQQGHRASPETIREAGAKLLLAE